MFPVSKHIEDQTINREATVIRRYNFNNNNNNLYSTTLFSLAKHCGMFEPLAISFRPLGI